MNKVKIGVLGLGEHGERAHLVHLARDPRVEIAAGFDIDAKKAKEFAERYPGSEVVESERKMMRSEIDAVLIMTPDRFHIDSSLHALKEGKHVLCEKPLVDKRADLQKLEDAIQTSHDNRLVYTSCHPRRFDKPFVWLKSQLPAFREQLGEVLDFDFDFSYHKPSKTDLHEGLLMDHANHEIDLVNFLFGGSKTQAHKLNDSQTRYRLAGQRNDGISFTFSGSRALESSIYPEFVRVRFERGELVMNTYTGRVEMRTHENGGEVQLLSRNAAKTDYVSRFAAVNNNFINAVLREGTNYLSDNDLRMNSQLGIDLTEKGSYVGGKADADEVSAVLRIRA